MSYPETPASAGRSSQVVQSDVASIYANRRKAPRRYPTSFVPAASELDRRGRATAHRTSARPRGRPSCDTHGTCMPVSTSSQSIRRRRATVPPFRNGLMAIEPDWFGAKTRLGIQNIARKLPLLICMVSKIPTSDCSLEDTDCICRDEQLSSLVAGCMLANCTMQDSLQTARVQADLCDLPNDSKRLEVFTYTGIVYSVAFLFVALRTAVTEGGFGGHLWNLEDGSLSPILRYFFICWSTYVIVLGLIKVSLVLFYLDIFKTPRFQIVAYVTLASIIISSLVIFLLTIFICSPIQSFWNRDVKGKCLDLQGIAYANSASAIAQDVILLVLPLCFVRNLQMKRYRKVAVGSMFAIGTFGCIATIVRFHTLTTFDISVDPTWDYVPVTVWTEVELAAGFVCVSLPSTRVLLNRILPTCIKEFLSHITHPSNKSNNSGPRPNLALPPPPPMQQEWRKPSGWSWISLGAGEAAQRPSGRNGVMSGLWSCHSGSPIVACFSTHTRNGSKHLEPTLGIHNDVGVAITCPSNCEQNGKEQNKASVELLRVPKAATKYNSRLSCKSCIGEDYDVTALPSIGCLPERSYSEESTQEHKGLARLWSRSEPV
ncbi:cytidine and deoxycytidylate deaminase zinc-binding region [Stemphylium lycopersici]|nr:cytidine and deoxycytidylate deaminase zinc-binding region [Stemphylium lycopersici]